MLFMRLRGHAILNAGQEKPETGIRLKLFTSTLRKHLQLPELQHLFSGGWPEILKISDNYVDNYRERVVDVLEGLFKHR